MNTLFNDNWQFSELPIDFSTMYKDEKPVLFNPEDFYAKAQNLNYKPVRVPHDWMIWHVKDLYKNSVGCYKKSFILAEEEIQNRHIAVHFEGVYMNSAVWINGKKAGEWKYGYGAFEFDISSLVQAGENVIEVLAVYQHCNTRWYSGAGIFRDVTLINKPKTFIPNDGTYFVSKAENQNGKGKWNLKIFTEVAGIVDGACVKTAIFAKSGKILPMKLICGGEGAVPVALAKEKSDYLKAVNSVTLDDVIKYHNEFSENVAESMQKVTSSSSSGGSSSGEGDSEYDELFVQAGQFIIDSGKASIGNLQRKFRIGFNRAARIMDQLCDAEVVGVEQGTKPREILMGPEQFEQFIEEYL